jgi:hypothetical protein
MEDSYDEYLKQLEDLNKIDPHLYFDLNQIWSAISRMDLLEQKANYIKKSLENPALKYDLRDLNETRVEDGVPLEIWAFDGYIHGYNFSESDLNQNSVLRGIAQGKAYFVLQECYKKLKNGQNIYQSNLFVIPNNKSKDTLARHPFENLFKSPDHLEIALTIGRQGITDNDITFGKIFNQENEYMDPKNKAELVTWFEALVEAGYFTSTIPTNKKDLANYFNEYLKIKNASNTGSYFYTSKIKIELKKKYIDYLVKNSPQSKIIS